MKIVVRSMKPRDPTWTIDAPPDDRSFVVASWFSSLGHRPILVDTGDWRGMMTTAIGKLLGRPEVKAIVAADAEAEPGLADLLGWMVYEPNAVDRFRSDRAGHEWEYRRMPPADRTRGMEPLIWYVYTKNPYRKHGIATRLFQHAGIDPRGRFHYVSKTPAASVLAAAGKIPRAALRPGLGHINERGPHGHRHEAAADADHAA